MTQVYTPQGVLVPVTVIQAGPCTVVATRRPEREGYAAAQVGFVPAKAQRLPKALAGHFTKAGTGAFAVLREFRLADGAPPAVGSEIKVGDVFKAGERVAGPRGRQGGRPGGGGERGTPSPAPPPPRRHTHTPAPGPRP